MKQQLRALPEKIIRRLPISSYPYCSFMHQYKCIFVHIPKNAGTSILECFGYHGSRWHARYVEYFRANSRFYHRYHKFAVVREPVERLYSSYCYFIKGGNGSSVDKAFRCLIEEKSHDFDSFVLNVLDQHLLMQKTVLQPQYLYIYNQQLECQMDTLLRYETLSEDWQKLAIRYSFPQKLPWLNKSHDDKDEKIVVSSSNEQSSSPKLSDSAAKKVASFYHFDFELLGYKLPAKHSLNIA